MVALIGDWPAPFTSGPAVEDKLSAGVSLVGLPGCGPIDWLLVETSIGHAKVADVTGALNNWGAGRPRVAVLDAHGIWPSAAACDVRPEQIWSTPPAGSPSTVCSVPSVLVRLSATGIRRSAGAPAAGPESGRSVRLAY